MLIIWLLRGKKSPKENRRSKSASEHENIPMNQFHPQRISVNTVVIACIAILTVLGSATSCQHGYMRHTVEVICSSYGNCTYNYSEEVLFNRISSSLCIEINHANKTIGLMTLTMKPVKLVCSKVSLFFTRETKQKAYYKTRCAEAGSCRRSKCSKMKSSEIVPELNSSSPYPGYSICDNTCGGLVCGCFLPLPACTFLRIAHIPQSETVYEVIGCTEWRPFIQLEVEFTLYNKGKLKRFELKPYLTEKLGEISVTVISLQKPHSTLMDKRFAIAASEAFMLPDFYQLPVECYSKTAALNSFANCTNRMICSCENLKAPQSCQCPPDSLQMLRKQVANVLPIRTPFTEIHCVDKEILAFSTEGEVTLAIESNLLVGSKEYIIDQPCQITANEVKGCYSCIEGAKVQLQCHTAANSWVTVQCGLQVFPLECGPKNTSSEVLLDFNYAVISHKCFTTCDGRNVTFNLSGILNYHPGSIPSLPFEAATEEAVGGKTSFDFDIPDLNPLIRTVKEHWKLATAVCGALVLATGLTYLIGPTAVLILAKLAVWLVLSVAKIAALILRTTCTSISKTVVVLSHWHRRGNEAL